MASASRLSGAAALLVLSASRVVADGPLVGSAECAEHASCSSCTLEAAWYFKCQWCKVDQRCYFSSSWEGPCQENTTVRNAPSCPAPTPPQTSFSLQEARDMILHADAVYFDDPISQGLLPPSFKIAFTAKYKLGTWEDAFAYLGVDADSGRIVAAFRGTSTFAQLADEILHHELVNETWDPEPGVLVNEYFVEAVDSLFNKSQLHAALEDLRRGCPKCEVWITGHSLGGAMAMLVAYRVALLLGKSPVVYTFGQPRTGNAAFSRQVQRRVPRFFRLVNAADPVPHVPPCDYTENSTCNATIAGYYHAGTEVWFPSGDYKHEVMCGYRECVRQPWSEDRSCSDAAISMSEPPHVSDHSGYFAVIPKGFCGGGQDGTAIVFA